MSSIEEKIGYLVAMTETQAVDIKHIKENMVYRREFDTRVSEHADIHQRIDKLESNHDKGHVFRFLAEHAAKIVVGVFVVAALALIGL